jgi:hypothetical protein
MLNVRDVMAAPTIDEITTQGIDTRVWKKFYSYENYFEYF